MRSIDNVELPDELSVPEHQVGLADWREPPHEVLDHVDELLKPYGLEVVMLPQGDDAYYWRIEPSPSRIQAQHDKADAAISEEKPMPRRDTLTVRDSSIMLITLRGRCRLGNPGGR
jgi:hypothetical protein